MPVFQYVVLNGKTTPELIEIEQAIGDKALSTSSHRRTYKKSDAFPLSDFEALLRT